MKILLALAVLFLTFPTHSAGIPQNFGAGGFFGMAGMRFEQFATSRQIWNPGGELKGEWRARASKSESSDGVETLDLITDTEVFGISPAQVSVEKAGGTVRRFLVKFDADKVKKAKRKVEGDLFARVTANLRVMAGEPQSKSPDGGLTFKHDAAMIVARRAGAREVLVEFTPAR